MFKTDNVDRIIEKIIENVVNNEYKDKPLGIDWLRLDLLELIDECEEILEYELDEKNEEIDELTSKLEGMQ